MASSSGKGRHRLISSVATDGVVKSSAPVRKVALLEKVELNCTANKLDIPWPPLAVSGRYDISARNEEHICFSSTNFQKLFGSRLGPSLKPCIHIHSKFVPCNRLATHTIVYMGSKPVARCGFSVFILRIAPPV